MKAGAQRRQGRRLLPLLLRAGKETRAQSRGLSGGACLKGDVASSGTSLQIQHLRRSQSRHRNTALIHSHSHSHSMQSQRVPCQKD